MIDFRGLIAGGIDQGYHARARLARPAGSSVAGGGAQRNVRANQKAPTRSATTRMTPTMRRRCGAPGPPGPLDDRRRVGPAPRGDVAGRRYLVELSLSECSHSFSALGP